jgi:hypothetical protein
MMCSAGDSGLLQAEYRELADEYSRAVKEFFGDRLVSICFFGSVARGDATSESDIDVLVVADKLPSDVGFRIRETRPIHERVRRTEAYRKIRSQGRSGFVSDLFFSPDEVKTHPPILLDLTDDGLTVYDKDNFLKSVLDEIKRKLKELGSKKVKAKKGYYWILKPDAKPTEVIEI